MTKEARSRRARGWWVVIAALGVAAGVGGAWLLAVSFAKPRPEIDYSPMANERSAGTAVEARAWPVYEAAAAEIKATRDLAVDVSTPQDATWPAFGERVRTLRSVLDRVREASQLPEFGRIVKAKPGSLAAQATVGSNAVRELTRYLWADALFAIEERDWDRAIGSTRAVLRMSEQLIRANGAAIEQITGLACFERGAELVREVATHPSATVEALDALATVVRELPGTYAISLKGERPYALDALQTGYGGPGFGGGRLTADWIDAARISERISEGLASELAPQSSSPSAGPKASSTLDRPTLYLQILAPTYEQAVAEVESIISKTAREPSPRWQRRAKPAEETPTLLYEELVAVIRGLRNIAPMADGHDSLTLRFDALATLIAIRRASLAGAIPTSFDELVPSYLPTIPLDPFDGKPLRWSIADGVITVYSVGPDLDDDSGRAVGDTPWHKLLRAGSEESPVDGDAVVVRMGG